MDKGQVQDVCHQLKDIGKCLQSIEGLLGQNGKSSSEEVWHVSRQDLGFTDQVTVHLRCNFLMVGDIDNVAQEFKAELFVSDRWEEPAIINKKRKKVRIVKCLLIG